MQRLLFAYLALLTFTSASLADDLENCRKNRGPPSDSRRYTAAGTAHKGKDG